MTYYVKVSSSGLVEGIFDLHSEVSDDSLMVIDSYDTSLLGQRWNGSSFEPLPIVETPPLPEQESFIISVGAFYDRFGNKKYEILGSANPMIQALVKDCSVRQFIDLKRSDLPSALDMIISEGIAIDKDAILNQPCQPGEAP